MKIRRLLTAALSLVLLASAPVMAHAYTVKKGDTLYRIAHNDGLTTAQIATANGIKTSATLRVGEFVFLPQAPIKKGLVGAIARPELFYSQSLTRGLSLGGSESSIYVTALPDEVPGYAIINPTSASSRELDYYGGVTTSGGDQLTGVIRGLAFYGSAGQAVQDVHVAANATRHSAGESIIMGNGRYEQNFADQLNGLATSSISGTTGNFTAMGGRICMADSNVCLRNNSGILQWTQDGFTSSYNFTSSSVSQLTASSSQGLIVTNSQIGINASSTTGVSFGPDGKLYQIVSSTRGLAASSTGLYIKTTSTLMFDNSGNLGVSSSFFGATSSIPASSSSSNYLDSSWLNVGTNAGQVVAVNSSGTLPAKLNGDKLIDSSTTPFNLTVSAGTQQNYMTSTIPAFTLSPGTALRIRALVDWAGGGNGGQSETLGVSYGTGTFTHQFTDATNGNNGLGYIEATIFDPTSTQSQYVSISESTILGTTPTSFYATSTFNNDSTATSTLNMSMKFNTNTGSPRFQLDNYTVEILR